MGNSAIIIRTVGGHHNGNAFDAEQIARRCVEELQATGHTVLSAHLEGSGSTDLLYARGGVQLRGYVADEDNAHRSPIPGHAPLRKMGMLDGPQNWAITNPDAPARAAYERYLHASGGKSLVSGAELPGWDALSPEIKTAWMAAVDHTHPRLQR
ncbi:MAG TPA: hypothetical protein VIV56_12135 [Gemmatimonadales bacterium]